MFDTFREPHFFTFSVIFSHIASIFTFSVELFSHLGTFSHIAAFSHLRVPQLWSSIGVVGVDDVNTCTISIKS